MPDRIKYYLLDWKDRNMELFYSKYGNVRLRDMTQDQIKEFFIYVTKLDEQLITK
jgi:hypothetical protein